MLPSVAVSTAFQVFQVFRQGATIVIAVALAWSGLTREAIGGYEMLFYIGYLATFFWSSGLLQAMLSLFPKLDTAAQRGFFVQAYLIFSGLSALLIVLLFLAREPVLRALVQQETLPYWPLFLVFLVTNIPATLQEHFYLLQERAWALIGYGALSAGAQVAVITLPPLLGYDFRWSFVGLVFVGLFKYLWLTFFVMDHLTWQWRGETLRRWWTIAWPLMTYAGLGAVNISIGAWVVGQLFAGDREVFGIYRYGARELPLLAALTGALAGALIPQIAKNTQQGLAQLKRESSRLQHLLFPLSFLLLLTAQWWFPFVFSEAYRPAVPVFNTFLLLTIPYFVFSRTLLIALEDTRVVPLLVAGSIPVHVALCWLLGNHFGLVGIALGSVLTFTLEKVVTIIYVQRRHGWAWYQYTAWRWWLGYGLVLLLAYAFMS